VSEKQHPLIRGAAWAARILPDSFKRWLYRTPPLAGLARRILNAAAPMGLSEVTIAAGVLQGSRMLLDLQSEKDYWLGTYEPELQAALRNLVHPGMTLFDVGANIGYVSLMAARLCGEKGHVFAFEALPKNVERLKKNVEMNALYNCISILQAAVMDKSGEAFFLEHASGAMGKVKGSAGRDEHYIAELRVPAIALDDFIYKQGNPPPQVVKMDIEGGEALALKGMTRLLRKERPVLLIELHGLEAAHKVWQELSIQDYRIHQMGGKMQEITSLEALGWKAYISALPDGKPSPI